MSFANMRSNTFNGHIEEEAPVWVEDEDTQSFNTDNRKFSKPTHQRNRSATTAAETWNAGASFNSHFPGASGGLNHASFLSRQLDSQNMIISKFKRQTNDLHAQFQS